MKKNNFVEGTFIAAFSIILVKIMGALYVIPFYKIVGVSGGALYSYGYTVYNLFLSISTAGIPFAISKLITEYNTLKLYNAKEKVLSTGKQLIFIISLIAFFFLFVFSKEFALLILGDLEGGNTLEDVSLIIKCVSFCLLIIPYLSVTKGYFQGHRYITPTSISEVIEQVVRISVILMGSYIVINILNKSVTLGVGVSMLGAFFGGLVAFLYLKIKMNRNKSNFIKSDKDDGVDKKTIIKKIIICALPITIIGIATDIYSLTDMTLVLRTMYKLGFSAADSEAISSIISTWSTKICMIINAVAIGMGTNIIPSLSASYAKKDYVEANNKFNNAVKIIIITALPLSIGLLFLSKPVYTIFYGESIYGYLILRFSAIISFFTCIHIVMSTALNSINKFKNVYIGSIGGFVINAVLDIPLMYLFHKLGMYAFYGASLATIISYIYSIIYFLISMKKELNFQYKGLFTYACKCVFSVLIMFISLLILNNIYNLPSSGTISILIYLIVYAIIGAVVYLTTTYKLGLLNNAFGEDYINKILKKLRLKKTS